MVIDKEDINYLQELFNDNRDLVAKLCEERTAAYKAVSIVKDESTQISFRLKTVVTNPLRTVIGDGSPVSYNYVIVVSYYYLSCGTRVKSSFSVPVINSDISKLIREKRLSQLIND